MRLVSLEPKFVELMPPALAEGTLYVSMTYATTCHLCACGCGNKVVLPLSPAEWRMSFDGESISLSPSIGNWEFPCRSHYWIKDNKIKWAAPWTDSPIAAGRQCDSADIESYFSRNSRAAEPELVSKHDRLIRKLRGRFRR